MNPIMGSSFYLATDNCRHMEMWAQSYQVSLVPEMLEIWIIIKILNFLKIGNTFLKR